VRSIAHGDTRGFLASVLQRVQTEVRQFGDFFTGCPDPEHTASVLWPPLTGEEFVGELPIAARHTLTLRDVR